MAGTITLYKGAKGKGKSLTMIHDGAIYYNNGWDVLSNMKEVTFGKKISSEEIINLDKNSHIRNCCLMLDEIQIFFDSRSSAKKENKTFSNFLQQIRKRNIKLLCTTQYANTVDLRLRQHLDVIVYPQFSKKHNCCLAIYVDMNSIEEDMNSGMMKEPDRVEVVFDAIPIYKLYNHEEVII